MRTRSAAEQRAGFGRLKGMTQRGTPDPYARCEEGCTHDLAVGVLVEELLAADGPHPPRWAPVPGLGPVPGSELRARLIGGESAA